MRFCDKLPKIRKENNLSQEQLADRLGVSRQAVSKWESGSSYPDMDKILQICKVLECNLEDLLDDGTVGNKGSSTGKVNLTNSLNDFLSFITKVYNMFCSMTFKEKIKCALEMTFIFILLITVGGLIYMVTNDLIIDLFLRIPGVGSYINSVFESLLILSLIIVGIIICVHILKIRYLDYFITVEDKTVNEKTLEKEILEEKVIDNKKCFIVEKHKPKIIIRDPKHSTLSFVNLLEKIVILIAKIFTCFIACPILLIFIGSLVFCAMSLCHINLGIMFLWISTGLLGISILTYTIINFIYNFIFNREIKFKLYFYLAITGIVVAAISAGLTIISFLNYDVIYNYNDMEKTSATEYIEMKENTAIYSYGNVEYIFDDTLDNIKIDITYPKDMNYHISKLQTTQFNKYHIYAEEPNSYYKIYKRMKKELKDGYIRIVSYPESLYEVKITISKENYNKLIDKYEE